MDSTLRNTTSKMLVYANGVITASFGGGEVENRLFGEAKQAMLDGKPHLLQYRLAGLKRCWAETHNVLITAGF